MSAFTRGNIVVYRVGTGAGALSAAATTVFLDEYTPAGVLVQSIALPTVDSGTNQTLTATGNAGSEGLLTLSGNGRYLMLTGYDAALGTATLPQTSATSAPRIVGRVDAAGTVDTSTVLTGFGGATGATNTNIRSVASEDGTGIYVAGVTGIAYTVFGSTAAPSVLSTQNARQLEVYGGQLYASSGSGTIRIATVGSGEPTSDAQTLTNLPGITSATTSSPYAFYLADLTETVAGLDTLYVADDASVTTSTGGLSKYSLVGGSWVSNGRITSYTGTDLAGTVVTASFQPVGLTGSTSGTTVSLFASTGTRLFSLSDASGYNQAFSSTAPTQIAIAAANTAFRGVAFAPSAADVSIGTISFATTSIVRTEGEGGATTTFTYAVTRTGATTATATVGYAVSQAQGTTTLDGNDYQGGVLPSGVVTFAAGQATATVTIVVANDQLIEANEGFVVTLAGASAGYAIGTATASGSIVNDDVAGAFSIARTSDAIEGGNATFTVTRTGGAGGPVDIAYVVVADGTATSADFVGGTLPSGTVRFEAGQTSAVIAVATFDDTLVEGNETFAVRLESASNQGTIATGTATATIIDNEDLPRLTISDPSVVEGNPGGTGAVLRYVVTSNIAAPAGGIRFDIATADGTAIAGVDYTARSIVGATISAGQTSYVFDVVVIGDVLPERGETVLVNLSNPQRAAIGDAQGVGTIVNDDGAPQGAQLLYATSFDGFTAAGFAPGATGARIDSNVFRVLGLSDLAAPAYGFTSPAIGAAANDFGRGVIVGSADPTSGGVYSPSANPALVIQPTGSDFVEGNGAIEARIQNATGFTATSFDVAFDWAYRNSGGRADGLQLSYSSDGVTFTAVGSSAFTTPGAADATVAATFSATTVMAAIGDVVVADGGYLYLRWSHTSSTGGGNRDEIGIDNLAVRAGVTDAPTLTFSDIAVTEGNGGTSFATITLTRTSIEGTASIGYATANGVAQAGSDYLAQSGTITFAAGEATKTIQIAINGDTRNEPNEAFFVNFANPNGFLLPDSQARVTILNDDTGPVAIYDIQGLGHRSTYEGLTVQTSGVVTSVRTSGSDRGYYLQDAVGDGDSRTSDAIFVSTGATSPTVAVGNAITLTGTVIEFTANAANLTITRLTGTTGTIVTNPVVALPTATLISTEVGGYAPPTQVIDDDRLQSYDPATDGIDYYESLEGMLVTVRAPLVVSSTDAIGQTYVVANGGIGATGINERFGIAISPGDNAPEKIKIFAPGGGAFDQGDVLGDVTGILTYFGSSSGTSASYEIDPVAALTVAIDRPMPSRETSSLVGDANHLTIASFNVENADPGDGAQKFQLIATEVTQALRNPDVIGLQEIQDADGAGTGADTSGIATAQAIIDAIVAAGGPRYAYVEIAPAYGTTGGEPGGNIRNAYLYNPERVQLYRPDGVSTEGSVRLIENQAFAGSRRPLVADFVFNGEVVTVVNAHSTSRGGSDTLFGAIQPPVQAGDASRTAQATAIKGFIDGLQTANPNANVVTLGDFNGYYYETALGRLTADGKLANLYDLLPVQERYSYLFEGYLQAFDNIVVSNNLLDGAGFDVVHYNAEQPGTVYRVTDHDQPLSRLYVPQATNVAPTLTGGEFARYADTATRNSFSVVEGRIDTNPTAASSGVGSLIDSTPNDTRSFALRGDSVSVVVVGGQIVGTVANGIYGQLIVAADGRYQFAPNSAAIDALPAGERVLEYTVRVTDGAGATSDATFTVALTGFDDPVTLTGGRLASYADTSGTDVFAVTSGTIDTDPSAAANGVGMLSGDVGARIFALAGTGATTLFAGGQTIGTEVNNAFGQLIVALDGRYQFAPNAGVINALSDGDVRTLSYTVGVTDLNGTTSSAVFTIDLVGARDDAVALAGGQLAEYVNTSAVDRFATSEGRIDGDPTAGVNGVGTLDGGAGAFGYTLTGTGVSAITAGGQTIGTVLNGQFGQLIVATDGRYQFAPNGTAIDALPADGERTLNYTVRVVDGNGAASDAVFTVHLVGAGREPRLAATSAMEGERFADDDLLGHGPAGNGQEAWLSAGHTGFEGFVDTIGSHSAARMDGIMFSSVADLAASPTLAVVQDLTWQSLVIG